MRSVFSALGFGSFIGMTSLVAELTIRGSTFHIESLFVYGLISGVTCAAVRAAVGGWALTAVAIAVVVLSIGVIFILPGYRTR